MHEQDTKKGKKAKAEAEKAKLESEAQKDDLTDTTEYEERIALKAAEHVCAFLEKENDTGRQTAPEEKDWSKEVCSFCGGKHLVQLRGKARCPNTIAEERGTAEANKANNTKCTYWVGKDKIQCGGSHSFEDHK